MIKVIFTINKQDTLPKSFDSLSELYKAKATLENMHKTAITYDLAK
jgi:hypothetical protein